MKNKTIVFTILSVLVILSSLIMFPNTMALAEENEITYEKKVITRAEMSRFLVQSLKLEDVDIEEVRTFPDVPPEHDYYNEISIVEKLGILAGYEDGYFRPNNGLTRAECALIFCRALRLDRQTPFSISPKIQINDIGETHWAERFIIQVVNLGLMDVDTNGNFRPYENMVMSLEPDYTLYDMSITGIHGYIYDQNEDVDEIEMSLYGSDLQLVGISKTDENGYYEFNSIPEGVYSISCNLCQIDDINVVDGKFISLFTTRTLEGDVNADQRVDINDIALMAQKYHTTGSGVMDVNHDNIIDIFDLVSVAKNVGLTLQDCVFKTEVVNVSTGNVEAISLIDNTLNDNKVRINGEVYSLFEDNPLDYIGVEVEYCYNADKGICMIRSITDEEKVFFDGVRQYFSYDHEVELFFNDLDCKIADNARIYINNKTKNIDGDACGTYGRFVLNDNGEIIFAYLFDFAKTGAVKEVNDTQIAYYAADSGYQEMLELGNYQEAYILDDCFNMLDAQQINIDSIIEYWEEDDRLFLLVNNMSATGCFDGAAQRWLTIGGSNYHIGDTVIFSEDNKESFSVLEDTMDMLDLIGTNVTVLLNEKRQIVTLYNNV